MTHRISRFAIHRTSATIGLMYGLFTLLFLPVILSAPPSDRGPGKLAFVLPLLVAVAMYLMIAIYCILYNLVARRTGGIEFTVSKNADTHAV